MQFDWISGLMSYGVFLFSVTLHEAAHAWSALRMGDDTAHRGGQVTLDPIPHIRREPLGMVVVPIIGWLLGGSMIGWASAPYDRVWAQRFPRRAALMAGAGPLANLLLVIVAALLMRVGLAADVFQMPSLNDFGWSGLVMGSSNGVWTAVAALLSTIFSMNLLLGLFNLLPVPPLDGSSMVTLLLPDRAAAGYTEFMSQPGFGLLGLLVAWKVFGQLFWPAWSFAVELLYIGIGY